MTGLDVGPPNSLSGSPDVAEVVKTFGSVSGSGPKLLTSSATTDEETAKRHSRCSLTQFFASLLTLLLAAFLCVESATAQTRYPVRLRLEPLSIRGRSGGPIPIRIKLEYNSTQIMEGDLYMEFYNTIYKPTDLMGTIRYEGIVLQGNDYFFDTVLPPFEHSAGKQYQITAWFETESERIPLSTDLKNPNEPTELLSIGPRQRATVICSCTGDSIARRPSENRRFLNSALSLDNYNPVPATNAQGMSRPESQTILTYAANWDAFDLPENPMHLCSFDIVLLADGALSRLDAAQLKALKTWCEAGGSICVLPGERNLKGIHLEFLQSLLERSYDPDLHLSLTDHGGLLVISDQQDAVINRHFGLGRVTLLPRVEDLETHLTSKDLGAILGHLWKARRDSEVFNRDSWNVKNVGETLRARGIRVLKNNGRYFVAGNVYNGGRQNPGYSNLSEVAAAYGVNNELPPQRSPLTNACESSLMPKGVKMVPTSIIALLLVAYVITIGPLDYFVLGYFRLRKYTWMLFPLVTAGFTALTIYIAHQHMASSETGGQLTIIDVVEDGRPVRQTDIRLYFYGEQKDYTEELKNTFSVPARMVSSAGSLSTMQQSSGATMPRLDYVGRFPQSCNTTLKLRQWEPQMTRSTTLTPTETDIPKIPWDDFSIVATDVGRQQLKKKLAELSDADTEIDAIVMHGSQTVPVFPHNGFLFTHGAVTAARSWWKRQPWELRGRQPPTTATLAVGILDASQRNGTRDFFSIVSQVSPHGSASLEDLPIHDVSNLNQWLLIVAVRKQSQTKIVRKLYLQNEERQRTSALPVQP